MDGATNLREAEQFSERILRGVSRTFEISIRLLPGELRRSVRCAYLLCRIADTVEDAAPFPADQKATLFDLMHRGFDGADAAERFRAALIGIPGDSAHVELAERADAVFAVWRSLAPRYQAPVRRWVGEMVIGMRRIVLEHPAGVRLRTMEEYHDYCYVVAGTVGHMLTELWRAHSPAIDADTYAALDARARAFGEALQTVNILKDVAVDAERENAIYVPDALLRAHGSSHDGILDPARETANHAALSVLIALAWKNLDTARDYLLHLPRRTLAARVFCALPLLYAYATLRDLTGSRAMLRPGGNVKIDRAEIRSLMMLGVVCAPSNAALAWLVGRVRRAPFVLPWLRGVRTR